MRRRFSKEYSIYENETQTIKRGPMGMYVYKRVISSNNLQIYFSQGHGWVCRDRITNNQR